MALVGVKMFPTSRIIFCEIRNISKVHKLSTIRHRHTLCIRPMMNSSGVWKTYRLPSLSSAASVRWSSQSTEAKPPIFIDESSLPPIPVPPAGIDASTAAAPDLLAEVVEIVAKEPSLASYGLGNYTPVGAVQHCLNYFHVGLDLPWWGSIVLGTVILRILLFPIVIIAQRNAAKMSNHMPQLQRLQLKMTEARQSGNNFDAARASQEMMVFMKEKQLNPLKSMIPPLAQAPVFISMFMGLRNMANVPIESLRTGGMLWFTDLSVPDQYYLLPLITSATLAVTVEVGVDAAKASSLGMMRYVLRAMPLLIFPFTLNFPGAVLCYWVSTNFISLIQVGVLRIPKVRKYFKIDQLVSHPKEAVGPKKGFVEGFKESYSNMKISRELDDRQKLDSANFRRAGNIPLQRTFKHDPTKVKPSTSNELLAKKKE